MFQHIFFYERAQYTLYLRKNFCQIFVFFYPLREIFDSFLSDFSNFVTVKIIQVVCVHAHAVI